MALAYQEAIRKIHSIQSSWNEAIEEAMANSASQRDATRLVTSPAPAPGLTLNQVRPGFRAGSTCSVATSRTRTARTT